MDQNNFLENNTNDSFIRILEESIKNNNHLALNNELLTIIKDFFVKQTYHSRKKNSSNPFNKYGRKCFSQSDEDGITIEIFKRLNNLSSGFFLELGVGDGTENNTLILLSLGWKGFWVGGSDLAFETSSSKKLKFYKNWITVENILSILNKGLKHLKVKELDF